MFKFSVLACIALASAAAATCVYSKQGHPWEFHAYDLPDCSPSAADEYHYGYLMNGCDTCVNLGATYADVESFVFTSPGAGAHLMLWSGADCKGTKQGDSTRKWIDNFVGNQDIKSFQVCPT
ncbi:hypothetical protein BV22DRAFT_1044158 [Leucogyrophana mollusca]|uniref:Uncharacterized protein n=1 Tax=Leucogyrophana mollusca TaxID=85980 RepID=A0ACB8BT14_9AGAM|nr:hypothetical protein BV22DRAFT_1044158 [Leucogyrophana mollusca]